MFQTAFYCWLVHAKVGQDQRAFGAFAAVAFPLGRPFAGGGQHRIRMGCIAGEGEGGETFEPPEAGQHEGGSFAGAGLRGSRKVVFVNGRDCLRL